MVRQTGSAPADTLRPPLKWAGGKRWLVPHLKPLWDKDPNRRLVEPLCGGLAVALGLRPKRALLNDLNPHNVNFYKWLKKGLSLALAMETDEPLYSRPPPRFNQLIDQGDWQTSEAAQLFYYLNRTGYNGLCRFNRRGEYNVPFGRHKQIKYFQTADFSAYALLFRDWDFTVGDFAQINLDPDDFVYADPPYDVQFTQYAKEGFTWDDQERLVEWLVQHPGPVVLSNQATPRIKDLYKEHGFDLTEYEAPRMISCTGDRSSATEVLATRG